MKTKTIQLQQRLSQLVPDTLGERRLKQQNLLSYLHSENCHWVTSLVKPDMTPVVYSVGLWCSFQHPEIIVLGVSDLVGKALLSDMHALIKLGQMPAVDVPLGQMKDYYPVKLQPVSDRQFIREHLPMANWFYGGESFPVLQLCWNDSDPFSMDDSTSLDIIPTLHS